MGEGCSDGGWAPDCKSGTLETQGVRIPLFPLKDIWQTWCMHWTENPANEVQFLECPQ